MHIQPITPVIGAEISGADLSAPDPAQYNIIRGALNDHHVVVFRDQDTLTPAQQIEFARQFGELHLHPAAPQVEGMPELFVIHTDANSRISNGNGWHTDVSCDAEPPMATCLQIHELPDSGGDTLFCNTIAAFESLSAALQRFLCTLSAWHESEHVYRGRYAERGVQDDGKVYPAALHPVARTHPESGRLSLFVNPSFTTRIEGLAPQESRALLSFLYKHQQRPEFQMRLRWQPNSVVLWDNRATQHFALWDYWPNSRTGHRVTIAGDKPIYANTKPKHVDYKLGNALG